MQVSTKTRACRHAHCTATLSSLAVSHYSEHRGLRALVCVSVYVSMPGQREADYNKDGAIM